MKDRCVAEVDSVFKLKENDDVTYEDYEKLVYLQQVLDYTLFFNSEYCGD